MRPHVRAGNQPGCKESLGYRNRVPLRLCRFSLCGLDKRFFSGDPQDGLYTYTTLLGLGLRSPNLVLIYPKVEKDAQCQKLLAQEFPNECLFTDLFDLMVGGDQIDNTALLDPKDIKFRSSAQCKSHGKKCRLPAFKDLLTILGAPCVLFSRPSSCLYSRFY